MVAKLRNFIYYNDFDSDFCFSPILVQLDVDENLTVFAIVEGPWEEGTPGGPGGPQDGTQPTCS